VRLPGYGVIVATTDRKIVDSRPDYSAELKRIVPLPSLDEMREPGNLLVNPSFEFDTTGTSLPDVWICRYPFSAVLVTDRPHSGKRCLKVTSPDADFSPVVIHRHVTVKPDREYELSGWFRSDGGDIVGRVYTEWVLGGKFYSRATPWAKGSATWRQLKQRFTAVPFPRGGLYVVIQTRGKGTAWFDDVKLARVSK